MDTGHEGARPSHTSRSSRRRQSAEPLNALKRGAQSGLVRHVARACLLTSTGIILFVGVVGIWETAATFERQGPTAVDIGYFYTGYARRWLDTGELYLPNQLAGPYHPSGQEVLFPPLALYLFVPFLVLPLWLWWAIPAGLYVLCFVRFRPAMWTYPVLAFILVWPRTAGQLVVGGSDMWVGAAVAGGLLFGWPFILVVLKPSFLPLAFFGIRNPSWWIALALLVIASIPLGGLWADYIRAMRNLREPITYSTLALPLVFAPVVMWAGRTHHDQPLGGRRGVSRLWRARSSVRVPWTLHRTTGSQPDRRGERD